MKTRQWNSVWRCQRQWWPGLSNILNQLITFYFVLICCVIHIVLNPCFMALGHLSKQTYSGDPGGDVYIRCYRFPAYDFVQIGGPSRETGAHRLHFDRTQT